MLTHLKLSHPFSYTIAILAFLLSFFILYRGSNELVSSVFAALLTGSLTWVSAVLVHWLYLAFSSSDEK